MKSIAAILLALASLLVPRAARASDGGMMIVWASTATGLGLGAFAASPVCVGDTAGLKPAYAAGCMTFALLAGATLATLGPRQGAGSAIDMRSTPGSKGARGAAELG